MKEEIKETIDKLKKLCYDDYCLEFSVDCIDRKEEKILLDYITNLQEENKIKDTNWENLKYYLEKLYYKDYIEEAISDDIDKKIKELESKVEIKGYQKEIKTLQEENKELKNTIDFIDNKYKNTINYNEKLIEYNQKYKQRNEKAIYKLQDIIESNNGALSNPEYSIIGKHSLLKLENDNCYILLNILKGDKDDN